MSTAETLKQEGRLEGLEIGEVLGLQRSLINVLKLRFGALPPGLLERLESISETAKLEELLTTAIQCESLESFSDAL